MRTFTALGIFVLAGILAGCGGEGNHLLGGPKPGLSQPGWTKYMGTQANTGLINAADAQGVIKWKFRVPGEPGPAVIGPDGTVYFGQQEIAGGLYALDGATGAVKWSIADFANFNGAPAIGKYGLLYVYLTNGLYALNANTGQTVWSQIQIGSNTDGVGLGDDGTVYIGTAEPSVEAYNGLTGALLWSCSTGSNTSVVSCPAIDINNVVYVTQSDGSVVAVKNGSVLWKVQTNFSEISSVSAGTNGIIYVRAGFNQFRAMRASDGTTLWSVSANSNDSGQTIGPDGTVYTSGSGPNVLAFSPTNGTVLRQANLSGNVGVHAMTTKTVYAETANGLTALDASTLQQKWNIPTGGFITGAAAVGPDGTVVFPASDFYVYAVR
ncbi:MAG: PQQ-binding-like beta-propeller repeat protein [Fimbriimonadaceae bacterium]|nr:PQQ-binding-like beta-propeller repeat protein [Fimbriimonadaceae bacterium]